MATFKVGQRVRIANRPDVLPQYIGKEGTFLRYETGLFFNCAALIDGEMLRGMDSTLEPLTDPRADEFIADMERFSKLWQPRTVPA